MNINSKEKPYIILIVLDAVRAWNMSAYGYPISTTPYIDGFANNNLLFRRAYAPATWTIPTHASLLTGLYLSQHRIENVNRDRSFNKAIVTLPQLLRSSGYQTAAFSQNLLFSAEHHLEDGFDEFYQFEDIWNSQKKHKFSQFFTNDTSKLGYKIGRYLRKMKAPRLMFDSLYQWFNTHSDQQPVFLMTNITNAHYPWTPPANLLWSKLGWDMKYLLKNDFVTMDPFAFNSGKRKLSDTHRRIWNHLYDAAIAHIDREIGRFLHQLRQSPEWSNTIVIITADHGELLGDYKNIVGHTLSLHDNLLHVPLIIRHPDYTNSVTIEGVVQTLDLYSSIIEWSKLPNSQVAASQYQRPSWSEATENASDLSGIAFAEEDYSDSYDVIRGLLSVNPDMNPQKFPRQQIAVHSAKHKYIWFDDRPGEFYDIEADPLEENNLLHSTDPVAQQALHLLQVALAEWQSDLELFPPHCIDTATELEPEVLARLRDLGYVA
jgi:arylsulfatase A-like enzyme